MDGEIKFYQTAEFKKLQEKWSKRLKKSGFEDHENSKGVLKVHNLRIQSSLDREQLRDISSALIYYIHHEDVKISRIDKKVLRLRAEGFYRKEICEKTRRSYQRVWLIIKKHTPKALRLYFEEG